MLSNTLVEDYFVCSAVTSAATQKSFIIRFHERIAVMNMAEIVLFGIGSIFLTFSIGFLAMPMFAEPKIKNSPDFTRRERKLGILALIISVVGIVMNLTALTMVTLGLS